MSSTPARPRGRPKSFDREATLDRTVDLLRRHGINSLSLNELTDTLGVSKAAFCSAFGDKDAALALALKRYHARFASVAEAALKGEGGVVDGLRRYFAALVDTLIDEDGAPAGCLLVDARIEPASGELETLSRTARSLAALGEKAMRSRLERAVAEGELAGDTDIAALSHFLLGQGGALALLARSGCTKAELSQCADLAVSVLQAPPTR